MPRSGSTALAPHGRGRFCTGGGLRRRRVLTLMPRSGSTGLRSAWPRALASRTRQLAADKGHQVYKLRVGLRARLRALEHDRTERAGGDDGAGAGVAQLLEADVADPRARLLFLVREQQAAASAAAVRVVAVPDRIVDVGAEARQERPRLVDLAGVATEVARVLERDHLVRLGGTLGTTRTARNAARQLLHEHRRVDDLDLVAELRVVAADRLHAVRARREDLLRRRRLEVLDVCGRELLVHVLVAGALGRIAVAALFRQHAEPHLLRPQDLEQRSQRLLEIGVERPGAAEPHQHVVLRGIEGLETGGLHELRALVVAEAPDVAAPLEVVVHRAEILGRIAVRHQAAPRTDLDRQVLDADRALVLARAAHRALPQHLLAVNLA